LRRRGLAHDAVVDGLAAALHLLDHVRGAVDRGPFLVGGDQQRERARVARMLAHEAPGGGDERGDRGLHVGGAAPEEQALALGGLEGIRDPLVEGARGDDVGMAGENHEGPSLAVADEQVGDLAARENLGPEAERHEAIDDELLAAGIGRRHRPTPNQRLRQLQGFVVQTRAFR
jgi:hypothetical protein